MRTLFVVILAVIVGCSSSPPPAADSPGTTLSRYAQAKPDSFFPEIEPVTIDEDFSESERTSIVAAFDEWNVALNGYVEFDVQVSHADQHALELALKRIQMTGQGRVVIRQNRVTEEQVEEGVLAYVPQLGSPVIIVIPQVIGNRDLRAILLHEIGHTLGLDHLSVDGNLMAPNYNHGAPCIDQLTVRALASAHRSWRSEALRSCGWGPWR